MPIHELKPYANNAKKHPDDQIEQIKKSIRDFGFNDPVAIWKNNEVIEGHGRLMAALELGMDEVPVIRLDHLTDDKRKAYALIHNKLTMNTPLDKGIIQIELNDIGMDLSAFDLNLMQDDPDGYYGKEQERTTKTYNLDILDGKNLTNDFWQMPVIKNDGFIPKELLGFKYAKTSSVKDVGIHFYLDDYQFERVWRFPERYIDLLFDYDCILSPDFSLYMDMPMSLKIWNVYRNRFLGAYYQREGLRVVPIVDAMNEGVRRIQNDFPDLMDDVNYVMASTMLGAAANNVLGYYDRTSKTVALNTNYTDIDKMNAVYDRSTQQGWHPSRGNLSGTEAVALHETGHALTHYVAQKMGHGDMDLAAAQLVKTAYNASGAKGGNYKWGKAISDYAVTKYTETVAEAVSDYYCNGSKAAEASKAIMNEIFKYK